MILSERRGTDLLLLTLQRPDKRNALSQALIEQLTRELRRCDADPASRGVILAGAGPSFCAGVDLHEFADASPDSSRALIEALSDLCATVRHLSKPVACAIQGHCLGGALELAACADFRISTPDAQLGMPEVVLGLPSVIDAVMLGHLIGVGRARELLLTGVPINGETAFHWGLVNRLATPGDHFQAIPSPQLGGQFGIPRSAGIEVRCFLKVAIDSGWGTELQHSHRCVARVPEGMMGTAWLEDQSPGPCAQFAIANLHPYLSLVSRLPRRGH